MRYLATLYSLVPIGCRLDQSENSRVINAAFGLIQLSIGRGHTFGCGANLGVCGPQPSVQTRSASFIMSGLPRTYWRHTFLKHAMHLNVQMTRSNQGSNDSLMHITPPNSNVLRCEGHWPAVPPTDPYVTHIGRKIHSNVANRVLFQKFWHF